MITDISKLASIHNRLDASSANRIVVIIICIDYICIAYICIVEINISDSVQFLSVMHHVLREADYHSCYTISLSTAPMQLTSSTVKFTVSSFCYHGGGIRVVCHGEGYTKITALWRCVLWIMSSTSSLLYTPSSWYEGHFITAMGRNDDDVPPLPWYESAASKVITAEGLALIAMAKAIPGL